MKKALLVPLACMVVLATLGASADAQQRRYTIKPRYFDLSPNDGFFDKGTWVNPYDIYDDTGRQRGTMQPKYFDLTPNDGFFDAGSWSNPYELRWGH